MMSGWLSCHNKAVRAEPIFGKVTANTFESTSYPRKLIFMIITPDLLQ